MINKPFSYLNFKSSVLLIILVSCISNSIAQDVKKFDVSEIEIKGIKLGMPQLEVEEIIGKYGAPKEFTIGGIGHFNLGRPQVSYINSKLSKFL